MDLLVIDLSHFHDQKPTANTEKPRWLYTMRRQQNIPVFRCWFRGAGATLSRGGGGGPRAPGPGGTPMTPPRPRPADTPAAPAAPALPTAPAQRM